MPTPAHNFVSRRERRRAERRPRRLLGLSALFGTIVVLSAANATGSFAFLNAGASASGATVSAGTADLVVASPFSGLALNDLYPGASVTSQFTVVNVGDVDLALSLDGVDLDPALAGHVSVEVGPAGGPTVVGGPIDVVVPAGESALLTMVATLSLSAPLELRDRASLSVTAHLTGSQQ